MLTNEDGTLREDILKGTNSFEKLEETRFNLSAMLLAGIYFLVDSEGIVLYVGETICFASRIHQHRIDDKIPFSRVEAIIELGLSKRMAMEEFFIGKYKPPYNRTLKSYATAEKGKANKRGEGSGIEFMVSSVDPDFDNFDVGDILK